MKTAFELCTVIVIAAFAFASPRWSQIGRDVIGRYERRVASGWYASCHEPPVPSPLLSPSETLAAPCAVEEYAREHWQQ